MRVFIIGDAMAFQKKAKAILHRNGHQCTIGSNLHKAIDNVGRFDYDCIVMVKSFRATYGLKTLYSIKTNAGNDDDAILLVKSAILQFAVFSERNFEHFIPKPLFQSELPELITEIICDRKSPANRPVMLGDLMINTVRKEIQVNEAILPFTRREYELVICLALNRDKILSRVAISQHLLGDNWRQSSFDFIYTHLKNIKKKLETAHSVCFIRTIRGKGYLLDMTV